LALHKNWDLEFEGNCSFYNISREKDLYFLGVNANVLFKPIQWNRGFFFVLGGGGLGYDSSGGRVEEIGDSHFGGTLQTGAGIYYSIAKGWAVRFEYRFQHMSEPFRTDKGLNTHNLLLGFSF
jgi:opacity protein-like surface antigen